MNGNKLREVLDEACAEEGCSMNALTVLTEDPFRLDTPARRRDGEWLATHAERFGLGDRQIHLRGLHYMLLSGKAVKPDGTPYTNTFKDWVWLQEKAGKAARWLGYLPFAQVVDARNAEPLINLYQPPIPAPYVKVGAKVEIPQPDEIKPRVGIEGFEGVQRFKLVLFGEKSSLDDVLRPLAHQYEADLYLPAGEISDTLIYKMARVGAKDGRRMIVLCLSDCDPSGWQMPISIGRKLQGFQALEFPDLEFEMHRVALTPDHVRTHGLPQSFIKETETRKDEWIQAMGVEQTEIDALAALNPELLRTITEEALQPFFDHSLAARVSRARARWLKEAQRRLEEQLDPEQRERLRKEAMDTLETLFLEIARLNDALRVETGDIDLPDVVVPEPKLNGHGSPLIDSDWSWVEQTQALKASKGYEG
jgi:hypothetical protein